MCSISKEIEVTKKVDLTVGLFEFNNLNQIKNIYTLQTSFYNGSKNKTAKLKIWVLHVNIDFMLEFLDVQT